MNAIIYARYSSDNQREESIEGQLRECQEYADKYGLSIIGTYIDRAFSAKTDDRPEFQRMIKDSSKKLFEVVLVWKLDRFARSRTDSAINKAILKKSGVRVVSAKENISESPEGIILEAMLEGYAEYFSAELAEKVSRGMKENALKCKYNGGGVPIGYFVNADQQLQIDPLTAPMVVDAYTKYADGMKIKEIVSYLNENGVHTYKNKPMSINSVTRMLHSRKYLGEYNYKDILIPGGIPSIVDEILFEKVQKRMERVKRAPARHKAEDDYLLTTKLFCGKCGVYMTGESGTSHSGTVYHYYKCVNARRKSCKKKTAKKEWIERLVVATAKDIVLCDEMINSLADAVLALQSKENNVLPLLRKQLREVEAGIENLLNAIQAGLFNTSAKKRLDDLEARKEDLEISIAQESIQKPLLTKEQIVFWISRFKDGDIDDRKYRQSMIDVFVNSVYLYDDKMLLNLNYKDGAKTVAFEEVQGSDLVARARPKRITGCSLQKASFL